MEKHEAKTYVITSAQYNGLANKNFLSALETYCLDHQAELLVLPMRGKSIDQDYLDPSLVTYLHMTSFKTGTKLNDKIKVHNYPILPQMIDPSTGLARFPQSDVSTIFASPKQRLKVVPNSNQSLPKVLMTTGAVTKPNYNTDNRQGIIAEHDHVYGAIVVDVVDAITYHYRQLTAQKNGPFVDLGVKYFGKEKEPAVLEALIAGDWHVGDTNEAVRQATFEMIRAYRPRRVIFHDFFNGHSGNHHEKGKLGSRARAAREGRLSLEEELKMNLKELYHLVEVAGPNTEIAIVASNHNEFLDRYLEEGRFMTENHNAALGAKLFSAVVERKNPLQVGLEMCGGVPKNVRFLKRDEDYKVRGWQLGAHGDQGANGARGGIRGIENAYGKSITGHSHTPEILRNTYIVGTSTDLRLDYTSGPSSWMNTHAMLWDNGKVQLVHIINGKWRRG